jgi:hypothetical protein
MILSKNSVKTFLLGALIVMVASIISNSVSFVSLYLIKQDSSNTKVVHEQTTGMAEKPSHNKDDEFLRVAYPSVKTFHAEYESTADDGSYNNNVAALLLMKSPLSQNEEEQVGRLRKKIVKPKSGENLTLIINASERASAEDEDTSEENDIPDTIRVAAIVPNKRPPKNFVYMIQSSEPTVEARLAPNPDRDVLYLCYKNKKEGCNTSAVPVDDVIVQPGSWGEGRNALLEFAMERGKEMRGDVGYIYYIFMDDDLPRMAGGEDPWSLYEQWLLETRPAVGYNIAMDWERATAPFNVDAIENAFHRNTLGSLLPYDPSLEAQSSFYSQWIMNTVVAAMYASTRRAFDSIPFDSRMNAHDTSNPAYVRSCKWSILKTYMDSVFREGTPSKAAVDLINCHTPGTNKGCNFELPLCPSSERNTTAFTTNSRTPGPVDEEWVHAHMDVSHEFTKQRLEFLSRHASFLRIIRQGQLPYRVDAAGAAFNCSDDV